MGRNGDKLGVPGCCQHKPPPSLLSGALSGALFAGGGLGCVGLVGPECWPSLPGSYLELGDCLLLAQVKSPSAFVSDYSAFGHILRVRMEEFPLSFLLVIVLIP